jgi:CheY-like chemotaxis protein
MADIETNQSALSIVLIDDNQALLKSMDALVTMLGHQVLCAGTGEYGIEIVCARRPDLVICDISLAGEVNGYGVARSLRLNRNFNSYLVAFSGFSSAVDCERALKAGFDKLIAKPANISCLVDLFELVSQQRSVRDTAK